MEPFLSRLLFILTTLLSLTSARKTYRSLSYNSHFSKSSLTHTYHTLSSSPQPSDIPVPSSPSSPTTTTNTSPQTLEKRNVILIIGDDFGIELLKLYEGELFGRGRETFPNTPNIDALASEGIRFTKAYGYPLCSSSRAAMLTGRYGFRTGLRYQVGSQCRAGLEFPQPTIPLSLADDVSTACIGKWHLGDWNVFGSVKETGFDFYQGIQEGAVNSYYNWTETFDDGQEVISTKYATVELTDIAIDWLQQNQDKQFFLWMAHISPHFPFHLPPLELHSFKDLDPENIDASDPEKILPYAYAAVEALDFEIGRLLEALDPEVRKRTTIIFLGDNGSDSQLANGRPYTPEKAKSSVYDGGIHVPMIIAGAGVEDGGRVSDQIVHLVDIYKTVLSIMGGEPNTNQTIDSYSLFDVMHDKDVKNGREFLISELEGPEGLSCDNPNFVPPLFLNYGRAILTKDYKIIIPMRFEDGVYYDESPEFYSINQDPFEDNNLLNQITNSITDTEYMEYIRLNSTLSSLLAQES